MKLLLIFIALNILNVILSTFRSIVTVKGSKLAAAVVNAVSYGLYTVVIVYTNADLPLWQKVVIVALTNLIGVYIVKLIEEKTSKDKLWKIDATFLTVDSQIIKERLETHNIPFACNEYGKHTMFGIYCQTQKESAYVAKLIKTYNGKYFISENRSLLF